MLELLYLDQEVKSLATSEFPCNVLNNGAIPLVETENIDNIS
jgi:hypothetical protein